MAEIVIPELQAINHDVLSATIEGLRRNRPRTCLEVGLSAEAAEILLELTPRDIRQLVTRWSGSLWLLRTDARVLTHLRDLANGYQNGSLNAVLAIARN